jgi:hypothetical protein
MGKVSDPVFIPYETRIYPVLTRTEPVFPAYRQKHRVLRTRN